MRDVAAVEEIRPPEPRAYGDFNWEGFKTLYLKEVRRFWKVAMQTVAAPVMSSLLFMLIFSVAASGARQPLHGVAFTTFIAPGLVMMAVLNNAFANSSSSILQSKMMGLTSDFLTPPLSPLEQTLAFVLGAATRGVLVGLVTWAAVSPFARMGVDHLWAVIFYGAGASVLMAQLGVLGGLWSEKWDHLATVQNFVVMPLTFLSGTFYLVDRLPEPFRSVSHFNPMFYLIDGFRYGFIGQADGPIPVGVTLTAALIGGMGFWSWRLFKTGYRLKT
ncbi:MAG TPA: ABC transporter permease [Caulobacteraceae bacterium]|jgi:ABC-2 type transport system permease protein